MADDELSLLAAYVASWRVCGRAPTIAEIATITGETSPPVAPLLRKRLLVIDEASGTERPSERAFAVLVDLGVTGLEVARARSVNGWKNGRIGEKPAAAE